MNHNLLSIYKAINRTKRKDFPNIREGEGNNSGKKGKEVVKGHAGMIHGHGQ